MEKAALGIYVHWPFCRSKCPYCDFNSHVREGIDQARWRAGLLNELAHYASQTAGRRVGSVFFGGGTPSLMDPGTVAALIEAIGRHWTLAPDSEITLEANPTSVEANKFAALASAGVNRVSLGIQALEDSALRFLGRGHDVREALAAFELARRHFARFSFDLIYARPGQSEAAWVAELECAADLAGEHISVYQLTIEDNTAFASAYRRGDFTLPSQGRAARLYEITQSRLEEAGLPAYEISNHARPGAECRHNLLYWQSRDYVGIGPGAHGRLTLEGERYATRQHRAPEAWLAAVEAQGHATRERRRLDPQERWQEFLMMGLRLSAGIDRDLFKRALGREIEETLESARFDPLVEGGFLELDRGGLRATAKGRQRLDAVLSRLAA
jgi:putative oxygen-independent coproporphyrinogen III oxidase